MIKQQDLLDLKKNKKLTQKVGAVTAVAVVGLALFGAYYFSSRLGDADTLNSPSSKPEASGKSWQYYTKAAKNSRKSAEDIGSGKIRNSFRNRDDGGTSGYSKSVVIQPGFTTQNSSIPMFDEGKSLNAFGKSFEEVMDRRSDEEKVSVMTIVRNKLISLAKAATKPEVILNYAFANTGGIKGTVIIYIPDTTPIATRAAVMDEKTNLFFSMSTEPALSDYELVIAGLKDYNANNGTSMDLNIPVIPEGLK